MSEIRLTKPSLGDEELERIRTVLASGYLTQGPAVSQFEELVASYVGVRHAFAMSSATTALHLGLVALGVGPGDEVVIPAYTFPATGNVVIQAGADVVMADVDPHTFAMTAETLEPVLTDRTAAIMPVDPGGYPAPMAELVQLARSHGAAIIEDAACGLGATRDGQPCGSFPDLGCFSFHPRKVITTGEGGMITTDDDELAERIALLRSHGGRRADIGFVYEAAGFNYRLSDVAGAIGIAQMDKLDWILDRRRTLARRYHDSLASLEGVVAPVVEEGAVPTYQSYVVRLEDDVDRDKVIISMRHAGVETTVGTYGLHLEPFYRSLLGLAPEDLPGATRAARQTLTLPLYPEMGEADVDIVVRRLADVIGSQA